MANGTLGNYQIMIASKYFESIDDFINLEISVKRFYGNMERFHYNPIPLNNDTRKFFINLETLHLYSEKDKIFKDGKIFKHCAWYQVNYRTCLKEKENDFRLICYSRRDRKKYGNEIPNNVKILGDNCFKCRYELNTIKIPKDIKELGNDCFKNCTSLKSIEIPCSVSKIGYQCFRNCFDLTKITLLSSIVEIGWNCFRSCDFLESITTNSEYFVFDNKLFFVGPTLRSVNLPSSVKFINGNYVVPLKVLEIPFIVNKLGNHCFSGCSSLTSIVIPSSVSNIGHSCFRDCVFLISVSIPSTIGYLSDNCFSNCRLLNSIFIPDSVREIGISCFSNCSCLKNVSLPESVLKIGCDCYSNCKNLTSIKIPSSITELNNVFFGCEQIKAFPNLPNGTI